MQSEVSYSARSAAVRAARKALGPEAIPGADFVLKPDGPRWSWEIKAPGKGEAMTFGAAAHEAMLDGAEPAEALVEAAKGRMSAKHRAALEAAKRGELPAEPDFSAETHKRWRPKLAEVVAMAKAGDLEGLRAYEIKPISTSPKAIDRYRNLAVVALEAKATRH